MRPLKKPDYGWSQARNFVAGASGIGKVIATLNAMFPEDDVYTVQFNLDSPLTQPGPGFTWIKLEASIRWSTTGGQTINRIVSVMDGMSISAPARGVGVEVRDMSIIRVAPGELRTSLVGIQVTRGVRAANKQAPIFEPDPLHSIAPAGSFTFNIPNDAGIISVFSSYIDDLGGAPAPGNYWGSLTDPSGVILKRWDLVTQPDWIPMSPGAFQLVYSNNAVGKNLVVTPTYGIDG